MWGKCRGTYRKCRKHKRKVASCPGFTRDHHRHLSRPAWADLHRLRGWLPMIMSPCALKISVLTMLVTRANRVAQG